MSRASINAARQAVAAKPTPYPPRELRQCQAEVMRLAEENAELLSLAAEVVRLEGIVAAWIAFHVGDADSPPYRPRQGNRLLNESPSVHGKRTPQPRHVAAP